MLTLMRFTPKLQHQPIQMMNLMQLLLQLRLDLLQVVDKLLRLLAQASHSGGNGSQALSGCRNGPNGCGRR